MPKQSPSSKRRGRLFRFGAACVVLSAVAGYVVVQYVAGGTGDPGCRVVSADGTAAYEFTPEQAVNAATIAAVGTDRALPERAVAIALATAIQESALRNLAHGDRDSLGLFQQRPSQGWGTEKQVTDPAYAADIFYRHLEKVRDYTELPLTVAAQRVQRSGYPEAYAKHEGDAVLLAAALTGASQATLTCDGRSVAGTATATPATTGPAAVRAALRRDFGRAERLRTDGKGASSSRSSSSSSSSSSRSADVPAVESGERTVMLPVSKDTAADGRSAGERGWQLAHWAVANASALRIERVSYAGREWVSGTSDMRWRTTGSTSAEGAGAAAAAGGGDVRIVTAQ
ncbi:MULTISPECIES: heavy metal transporter [unclassified Streptomyces]|uniref:heavy metal transporter n=1 Tax=unclassified Streptomyces TaxID=2593676 RepID=UPI0029A9FF1D|nr:heavy metal transporter [Streptomyces sp. FL07-04A]MDX3579299.1 heavy metal transporter [Streptomyces sp. FL07-04A]